MICTKCGKREATTMVYTNNNGRSERMYLCDECKKAFFQTNSDQFDMLDALMSHPPMGLVNSLNGFFGTPTKRLPVCPDCKTTGEEFLNSGFVGCPTCYKAFEPLVVQTVKKLQQSDRHVGKCPAYMRARNDEDVARLKAELNAAIRDQDYVRAGEISGVLAKLDNGGAQ